MFDPMSRSDPPPPTSAGPIPYADTTRWGRLVGDEVGAAQRRPAAPRPVLRTRDPRPPDRPLRRRPPTRAPPTTIATRTPTFSLSPRRRCCRRDGNDARLLAMVRDEVLRSIGIHHLSTTTTVEPCATTPYDPGRPPLALVPHQPAAPTDRIGRRMHDVRAADEGLGRQHRDRPPRRCDADPDAQLPRRRGSPQPPNPRSTPSPTNWPPCATAVRPDRRQRAPSDRQ
jgi:hypothetical protein